MAADAFASHQEISPWELERGHGDTAPTPNSRVGGNTRVTVLVPTVPPALQSRRDDAWLVARVGRVSPDPFEVLFERHWARLRAYCLGILGSADEAQDAGQESMVRAYRRLWRAKDAPPFKPLLFAIARNACIDRLRERSRDGGPVEEHHLPAAAASDEVVGRRGRVALLVADLRALSERQRTALVLREACGLSHGEIAETLDTTPARVKSLISEARQALTERGAGRELSCEEYRRALVRVRGRLRNQSLLAHRATCGRCGEAPAMLYALGLPGLALAWLLRGARGAVRTVAGAPAATPTAAKLAVAAACLGTATMPVAVAPDVRDEPRTSVASAAFAPRASTAPTAGAGRTAPARADTRRRSATAVPGAIRVAAMPAPAEAPTGTLPRDSRAAGDGIAAHRDLQIRRGLRDAASASLSALPGRVRGRLALMDKAATGVSRRTVEATRSVSRVARGTVRDVERATRPDAVAVAVPVAAASAAARSPLPAVLAARG